MIFLENFLETINFIIMMTTKACDPIVLTAFELLKKGTMMGIRNNDGLFIGIPSINIDPSGKLFYLDEKKRRTSVSSLIIKVKGLQTARWLDHLYFIDRNTDIVSFKKFISSKYDLNFS